MSALTEFLNVWSGHLADDVAHRLTCNEVEVLTELLRANGRVEAADRWISAHAKQDDEGDDHYEG